MNKDLKLILVMLCIIVILAGLFVWKVVTPKDDKSHIENSITNTTENDIDNWYEKYNQKQDNIETLLNILSITFFIIGYILQGLAIYKIAQQEDQGPAWLAFIPIAQWFLISKVAFDGDVLFAIIYFLGSLISLVWENTILDLIVSIVGLYILYNLFKKFSDKPNHNLGNLIALELLSVLILYGFCFMILSDYSSMAIVQATAQLALSGPTLVAGLYLYRFNKKYN